MRYSVMVPAYKRQFLGECIDSILNQTYDDFELIVVNDASPEDLDSVVKAYDDPRLRYFVNEKNCGAIDVVDNWNICLSHAKGDYVICMGDDDRLLPNCLEEYNRLIATYPGLGVYHAWTEIINEKSVVIDMQEPRPLYEDVYSMIWWRWHGRKQFIGDFLFDRALLEKNGGFYKIPLAWGSDDISAFIAAKDTGIANGQVPMFQYRKNTKSISSTGKVGLKMETVEICERWFRSFLAQKPAGASVTATTYWKLCKERLKMEMSKKRVGIISSGIDESPVHGLIYFIRNRKRFHINCKHIGYAWMISMRTRFKQ